MFYRANTLLVRTVVDRKLVVVERSRDIGDFGGLVKEVVGNGAEGYQTFCGVGVIFAICAKKRRTVEYLLLLNTAITR